MEYGSNEYYEDEETTNVTDNNDIYKTEEYAEHFWLCTMQSMNEWMSMRTSRQKMLKIYLIDKNEMK